MALSLRKPWGWEDMTDKLFEEIDVEQVQDLEDRLDAETSEAFYAEDVDAFTHPFKVDEQNDVVRPMGHKETIGKKLGQSFWIGKTQTLSASSTVTIKGVLLPIVSSGGLITLTSDPQIANGVSGQLIILKGTSDTDRVAFQDGNGLQLSATATLSNNDTLTLIYDETDWIEIARSNA